MSGDDLLAYLTKLSPALRAMEIVLEGRDGLWYSSAQARLVNVVDGVQQEVDPDDGLEPNAIGIHGLH